MTAVVSGSPDRGGVLPRLWDGHRLLRFLTGLAMIALAFTVRVGPLATAGAHAVGQPVTHSAGASVAPGATHSAGASVAPSDGQPITQSIGPSVALPARASVAPPAGRPITQTVGQPALASVALPAQHAVAAGGQARSRATTVAPSAHKPVPALPHLAAAVPADIGPLALGSAVFLLVVAGYALRVRAQRAPPLA